MKAQLPWISAGPDDTVCYGPVNIQAVIQDVPSTSSYSVNSIPFSPLPAGGTAPLSSTGQPLSNCDDCVTGALPVGFTFCFFDQSYTQFYIGTNGWISFSPNVTTTSNSSPLPDSDPLVPKNTIMGPWQDWLPGANGNGQITYQTIGTAPFRKLVVTYSSVPLYFCTSDLGDFQIILYETTNVIESHITSKPNCPSWQNGTAVLGIQNDPGTVAFTVAGKNSSQWTASNESWRFVPNGPPMPYTVTWKDLSGTQVGTGNPLVLNDPQNTSYIATVNYTCSNVSFSDTMNMVIGIAGVSISTTDADCYNSFTGTADIDISSSGSFEYQWSNGMTTDSISGLAAGTYTVTIIDSTCFHYDTLMISEPSELVLLPAVLPDTCGRSQGAVSVLVSGGTPGYSVTWSTGSSGPVLQNLAPGSYTATVTDSNGCITNEIIMVGSVPGPDAVFSWSPADIVPGEPVTFTDISSEPGGQIVSWIWDFSDSTYSGQQPDPVFFEEPGIYCVRLVIMDEFSCIDSVVQCIGVSNEILVPNIFTPNGDGINDVFEIRNIRLYPGNLLRIYDRWGEEILNIKNYDNSWKADGLTSGTYYYILQIPSLEPVTGFFTLIR